MGHGATQEELKAAHRRLVRRHHPDLVPPARRAAATRRVQEVNVAYGLVRDPEARARYDRLRHQRARSTPGAVDQALAAQWDALVLAAGRWAAAWWVRGRRQAGRQARRAALRARRAGLGALGRLLWLLASAAGAVTGLALGVAVQRLAGVQGYLTPLAGLVAGGLAGSQRGWHRRLRLSGFPADATARRVGTAVAAAAIAAALWADVALGG